VEGGINLHLLLVFLSTLLPTTFIQAINLSSSRHEEIVKMDVDKMFKLPALPSGAGNKRKFPDAPAPG
jgi:hypothetical protein